MASLRLTALASDNLTYQHTHIYILLVIATATVPNIIYYWLTERPSLHGVSNAGSDTYQLKTGYWPLFWMSSTLPEIPQ